MRHDPVQHLRSELSWVAELLRAHVDVVLQRGRTPVGEAMSGLVIEAGEVGSLADELSAAWSAAPRDARREPRARHAPSEADALPLLRACDRFELEPVEYVCLLLAIAVEVDGRFGRLVAYLNDHAARTRPTIGLALSIAGGAEMTPVDLMSRPCMRDGLMETEGEGPLAGLALRVPSDVLPRLTGATHIQSTPSGAGFSPSRRGLLSKLVLPEHTRRALEGWVEHARQSGAPPHLTVLVGDPGVGRRTVAAALASELGRPIAWVDAHAESLVRAARLARRESRWHDGACLLRINEPLTETQATSPRDEPPHAPVVLAVAPAAAGTILHAMPSAAVIELQRPELAQRCALWTTLAPRGPDLTPDQAAHLAARYRFNPGKVARTARLAAANVSLARRNVPTADDLAAAARELARGSMDGLAERLELPFTWDQLVVPDHVASELRLALAWLTKRKQVLEDWGLGKRIRVGRGLAILLCGPPGTGKTMAAQVMARQLGVDLFRIELSAVMSKYIGETEKHLRRLFAQAEESGAALLFDECDVLLSKRTEVRDARDKWANAEAAELLPLIENTETVTFWATNRAGDLDEAYTRRFPFILSLPAPDETDRRRLWEGLLPSQVLESKAIDVAELARVYKLTGGEIKNAVLAGAYAAAAAGRTLNQSDVSSGVHRELRKQGKSVSHP